MTRIPDDAFERYVAMGQRKSYRQLAESLGVSKRAVSKAASREDWAGRLARIDHASRLRADERIAETRDEMRDRHLRSLRAIQGRALEALRSFRLNSAAEAVSALEKAIRMERIVVGESSDRTELSVREITMRELDLLIEADDVTTAIDGSADEVQAAPE